MLLVPFHETWAGSETKLDLKAWYRRGSVHGGYSLVGPLPLRRHLDWARKGFEYVSLSTLEELGLVAPMLRASDYDVDEMRKCYIRSSGKFDTDAYLKDEARKSVAFQAELQAKVDKFGAEAVTEIMRSQDPDFVMPEGIAAKRATKREAVA